MSNRNQPISPILDSEGNGINRGLTKREYFAGLAMQGLISSYDSDSRQFIHMKGEIEPQISTCIDWADELLKQLEP